MVAGSGSGGTVAGSAGSGGITLPAGGGRAGGSGGAVSSAGNATAGGGFAGSSSGRSGGAGAGGLTGAGAAGLAGAGGSAGDACILRVSPTGSDSNSGDDWTQAFGRVQRGLEVARDLVEGATCETVEVWLAAGTYRPSARLDALDERTATFVLVPGVALYGGFVGTESALVERNVTANVTVLSGDIGTPYVATDNSYHVVIGKTGATLDGITVTGGYANGSAPNNVGGGMYNEVASPTLRNCTFTGNASAGGGGMYNLASSPVVEDSTFSANDVLFGNGGGMLNVASSPRIARSLFTNNAAQYSGGALSNEASSVPNVKDCTFTGNAAVDFGGAMHNHDASPVVTNGTFDGNRAYGGGAMYNDNSRPVVANSTFVANSAYTGGALSNHESLPVVTNSIFAGNSAQGTARFTGDAMASGGALYGQYSTVLVTGSTFTGNGADYSGGAIHNGTISTLTVTNTILWGDSAAGEVSEIVDTDPNASSVSYSIVADGFAGSAVITADPRFVAAEASDFTLHAGSPAIDAGIGCSTGVTLTDQAGNGRWDIQSVPNVVNGFDIGAFEYLGNAESDTLVSSNGCEN